MIKLIIGSILFFVGIIFFFIGTYLISNDNISSSKGSYFQATTFEMVEPEIKNGVGPAIIIQNHGVGNALESERWSPFYSVVDGDDILLNIDVED